MHNGPADGLICGIHGQFRYDFALLLAIPFGQPEINLSDNDDLNARF
ncbi:MAG: hypothetical protein GY861_13180 [bacterium]|nr:hypothetical protein [bacterium]